MNYSVSQLALMLKYPLGRISIGGDLLCVISVFPKLRLSICRESVGYLTLPYSGISWEMNVRPPRSFLIRSQPVSLPPVAGEVLSSFALGGVLLLCSRKGKEEGCPTLLITTAWRSYVVLFSLGRLFWLGSPRGAFREGKISQTSRREGGS